MHASDCTFSIHTGWKSCASYFSSATNIFTFNTHHTTIDKPPTWKSINSTQNIRTKSNSFLCARRTPTHSSNQPTTKQSKLDTKSLPLQQKYTDAIRKWQKLQQQQQQCPATATSKWIHTSEIGTYHLSHLYPLCCVTLFFLCRGCKHQKIYIQLRLLLVPEEKPQIVNRKNTRSQQILLCSLFLVVFVRRTTAQCNNQRENKKNTKQLVNVIYDS